MARASFYLCKYANLLIFEDFDEALISTIDDHASKYFYWPSKTFTVESKIYDFNNANEDAIIFLTTNFALTFLLWQKRLKLWIDRHSLLLLHQTGWAFLTAWSAEKFTAQIAARLLSSTS